MSVSKFLSNTVTTQLTCTVYPRNLVVLFLSHLSSCSYLHFIYPDAQTESPWRDFFKRMKSLMSLSSHLTPPPAVNGNCHNNKCWRGCRVHPHCVHLYMEFGVWLWTLFLRIMSTLGHVGMSVGHCINCCKWCGKTLSTVGGTIP